MNRSRLHSRRRGAAGLKNRPVQEHWLKSVLPLFNFSAGLDRNHYDTTNLKIGVVHKENPAGRAITKLLTSLDLEAEHAQLFVRPVGREEADANTARTPYDLATHACAAAIPKTKVVIATTGLVWEQNFN